jgi:hypothetical protein
MKKYVIAWNLGSQLTHLDHLNISVGYNGDPIVGSPKEYINSIKEASFYFKKAITLFPNHDIEIIELQ